MQASAVWHSAYWTRSFKDFCRWGPSSPFSAGPSKGANSVVTIMDWLVVQVDESRGRPIAASVYRSRHNRTAQKRLFRWSLEGFRRLPAMLLSRTKFMWRPSRR